MSRLIKHSGKDLQDWTLVHHSHQIPKVRDLVQTNLFLVFSYNMHFLASVPWQILYLLLRLLFSLHPFLIPDIPMSQFKSQIFWEIWLLCFSTALYFCSHNTNHSLFSYLFICLPFSLDLNPTWKWELCRVHHSLKNI